MGGGLATLLIAIAVLFLAIAAAKATRVMAAHRERLDALGATRAGGAREIEFTGADPLILSSA
jgi:hypothetical protein